MPIENSVVAQVSGQQRYVILNLKVKVMVLVNLITATLVTLNSLCHLQFPALLTAVRAVQSTYSVVNFGVEMAFISAPFVAIKC